MRTSITIALFTIVILGGTHAQTLDDYLSEAAANNPGLKAHYAQFEAAVQRGAQAAQMPNPTLNFGYFIQPIETRVGPQQAKIGLSQMFPWFGTLKAKSDRAAYLAEAKYYLFIDARERLFESIKEAYYALYENQKLVEIEESNLDIFGSLHTISKSKYVNDMGSMADVYRVEIAIDESRTVIELLKEQRSSLEFQFNNLLNRGDTATVHVTDSLSMPTQPFAESAEGFTLHPRQLSIAEMKSSADAAEQAAKRSGYPGFGLGVDYVLVGDRTDMNVAGSGKDALMPMLSLSLPIYRKGYTAARKEAQKLQEAYAEQSLQLENELESELDRAVYDRLKARSNYDLLHRQIAKTETIVELLINEYSNDAMNFEVLLREQQNLLNYQKDKVRFLTIAFTTEAHIAYLNTETNENK
ncbi:MAG: TolC family protein [Flavobacteriales bacterium]|nr:TolC family protein [Flavobacteriales bacterium]